MNNHTLRLIVIEDEPSIQGFLVQELNKLPNVEVIGTAQQIDEAFQIIIDKQPDALFLDIKIIGGDAFQLIDRLIKSGFKVPHIALCTGFPEYAIEALNDYRRYIIKYLTKPLEADWEERIKNIVDEFWVLKKEQTTPFYAQKAIFQADLLEKNESDSFFILCEGQYRRITLDTILWLETAGSGFTFIVTDTEDIRIDTSMFALQKKLDAAFCQISRSNIINLTKIHAINRGERQVAIERRGKIKLLSVSDTYYNDLLEQLGIRVLQNSTA